MSYLSRRCATTLRTIDKEHFHSVFKIRVLSVIRSTILIFFLSATWYGIDVCMWQVLEKSMQYHCQPSLGWSHRQSLFFNTSSLSNLYLGRGDRDAMLQAIPCAFFATRNIPLNVEDGTRGYYAYLCAACNITFTVEDRKVETGRRVASYNCQRRLELEGWYLGSIEWIIDLSWFYWHVSRCATYQCIWSMTGPILVWKLYRQI